METNKNCGTTLVPTGDGETCKVVVAKTLSTYAFAKYGVKLVEDLTQEQFTELLDNEEFVKCRDMFGEPLLQTLIYTYRQAYNDLKNGEIESIRRFEAITSKIHSLLGRMHLCSSKKFEYFGELLNMQNVNLQTPIVVASERNVTAWIVKELLKMGADVTIKDDIFCNAFETADRLKDTHLVKLTYIEYYYSKKEIDVVGQKDKVKMLWNDELKTRMGLSEDSSQEYVDLGLPSGLKWAKCNVGAKKPEEFGKYFRWGEITDAREMGYYGNYDYDKPFEDAATYHMGKQWRMPTTEEFQELYFYTTSMWITNYQGSGVKGRLFTSNINGQTLFFPAAGNYNNGSVCNIGSRTVLWSSSLVSSYPYSAYYLGFGILGVGSQYSSRPDCWFSVRGVRN